MKFPANTALRPLLIGYFWALVAPLLETVVLSPFYRTLDLSNAALLYVLGVVVVAIRFGPGAAALASLIASLCFAHVFVPPHFSLAITEPANLVTALLMLSVALLVGHMTARMKRTADYAVQRSREHAMLYDLGQGLAGAPDRQAVIAAARDFYIRLLDASNIHIYLPEDYQDEQADISKQVRECAERREIISRPAGNDRFHALVPLATPMGVSGVFSFEVGSRRLGSQDAVQFIETAASVVAVALERAHYAEHARRSELQNASESLRSSILAALSHDLRTPLTALVGMAETVSLGKISPERQRHMLEGIRDRALSISQQMTKLLDMAKLSAGKLELNTAWQPIDEVVGATLQLVKAQWKEREITVDLPSDLPPVNIDAVLVERVLWNLIENAIKYAPTETPIEMRADRVGETMEIEVCDAGPGLAPETMDRIFDRFQRGKAESNLPGIGLGLSIAKTIIVAHGGSLSAHNRSGGGSCFRIVLPLGTPPCFDTAEAAS
ncbi:ATP-binding protein [Azonexus sp.]|jgi:two-component system sensor histidine kinase KdpD|uniref:ATP-binding protein n=1 Tax=Azonexus sp. TaxID=1872668 RepID=UPI002822ABD4|nr:ATP-binding protein [Azonexus sp.]MDR1994541.1 PAS domain-containing sensor histidine kinase [Azonexus sp.]